MLADLPRLLGGSAVGWSMVMNILRLSVGRGFDPTTKQRHAWSTPVSLEDLSDLCRCDIRQLQRQIAELSERGVIQSKGLARGLYPWQLFLGLPIMAGTGRLRRLETEAGGHHAEACR